MTTTINTTLKEKYDTLAPLKGINNINGLTVKAGASISRGRWFRIVKIDGKPFDGEFLKTYELVRVLVQRENN